MVERDIVKQSVLDPNMASARHRQMAVRAIAGLVFVSLGILAWAQPGFADTSVLIGKMTGDQCRARGGVPVEVVPTAGQNPDPARACFVDPSQRQIQGIQPSWLCPDGKTPMAATGGCPG